MKNAINFVTKKERDILMAPQRVSSDEQFGKVGALSFHITFSHFPHWACLFHLFLSNGNHIHIKKYIIKTHCKITQIIKISKKVFGLTIVTNSKQSYIVYSGGSVWFSCLDWCLKFQRHISEKKKTLLVNYVLCT